MICAFRQSAGAKWDIGHLLYQVEELVPGTCRCKKRPGESRCRSYSIGLLDAPDLHACMRGFDYDGDAERVQRPLDAVTDFDGQPLLDLEPSGVCLHDPGDFAEPGDLSVRDVSYVRLADERQHVMFAHGVKVNVLDKHHLLVFFIEYCGLYDFISILRVSLGKKLERLRHPFRCLQQALALRVLSKQLKNLFYVDGYLLRRILLVYIFRYVSHNSL